MKFTSILSILAAAAVPPYVVHFIAGTPPGKAAEINAWVSLVFAFAAVMYYHGKLSSDNRGERFFAMTKDMANLPWFRFATMAVLAMLFGFTAHSIIWLIITLLVLSLRLRSEDALSRTEIVRY